MKNFKEKANKVWEEHKDAICGAALASIGAGMMVMYYANKSYKIGFIDGIYVGFEPTIKWMNENLPESNALELWEAWKKANPDKLVHQKTKGKWS